jgi:hypothetical protein
METLARKEKKNDAVAVQATTPDQLLALAINKDLDIDKLAKLMELQRDYNADLARKAFFSALSDFQIDCPEIRKGKEVSFGNTKYSYAPLADIDRQIKKTLKDNGLSKRWEIQDSGEDIEVVCIITHVDGHFERTGMRAKPDGSGSKNPIQARGSAIEYMKRYTLIGALGLTTTDTDIDGRLPELDVDKLHKQYMELFNKIVEKDPNFRTPGDPDNWDLDRTAKVYVAAIGKARQILAKLSA